MGQSCEAKQLAVKMITFNPFGLASSLGVLIDVVLITGVLIEMVNPLA